MKLTKSIEIEVNGTKKLIHFSGLLDRIDKVGNNYRYFMVYERRTVDGAYNMEDFLNVIKDI